ncbi:hypothetical protein P4S64_17030 [Vibrio sp. M60_M31a]
MKLIVLLTVLVSKRTDVAVVVTPAKHQQQYWNSCDASNACRWFDWYSWSLRYRRSGAKDEAAKEGALSMRFGLGWAKSHSFHTGQCPVMKYHRGLMQSILFDKVKIADAVNVQMISLDQAPQG